MDVLDSLGEIVRFLLIVIGALSVVLVFLIFMMLRMHRDNPLKRFIRLLTYRVAATALAGLSPQILARRRPQPGRQSF